MKNLFILFCLLVNIAYSQSTQLFSTQTAIDTFKGPYAQALYIYDNDTSINALDPITNIDNLKNFIFYNQVTIKIFYTRIKTLDFSDFKFNFLYSMFIEQNRELKEIKGMNKVINCSGIVIDSNSKLETIDFNYDSLNGSTNIYVFGNPSLKSVSLAYNKDFLTDRFENFYYIYYNSYGHGVYINNNPSLRKIIYNKKLGKGRISRFWVLNNRSLDSIIVNKVNNNIFKYTMDDTLSSTMYKKGAAFNEFENGIFSDLGVRFNISNNDSLRYVGGGFEKDTFSIVSLLIKNNPKLTNLCLFKPAILAFPNPQSNLPLLYQISNNAIGTSSLAEITSTDCSQKSGINTTVQSQNLFNLYPNPNHGNFQLKFPDEDMYDVTVINYLGIKVYHSMASNSNNVIHLTHIPKGNYILKCMNKNYDKTIKLLVE